MFSGHLFDNRGNRYDVTRILDEQQRLNATAYAEYSPPFLSSVLLTLDSTYSKQLSQGVVRSIIWHCICMRNGDTFPCHALFPRTH